MPRAGLSSRDVESKDQYIEKCNHMMQKLEQVSERATGSKLEIEMCSVAREGLKSLDHPNARSAPKANAEDPGSLLEWQQQQLRFELQQVKEPWHTALPCLDHLSQPEHSTFQVHISGIPLEILQDYYFKLVAAIRCRPSPLGSLILSNCKISTIGLNSILEAVATAEPQLKDCLLDLSENNPDRHFVVCEKVAELLSIQHRRRLQLQSMKACPAVQRYLKEVETKCAKVRLQSADGLSMDEPSRIWWATFFNKYSIEGRKREEAFSTLKPKDPNSLTAHIEQTYDNPRKRLRMARSTLPMRLSFKLKSDVPYPKEAKHKIKLRKCVTNELALISGLQEKTFPRVLVREGSVHMIVLVVGVGGVAASVVCAYIRRRLALAADLGPNFVLGRVDHDAIEEMPMREIREILQHADGRKRILSLDGGGIKGIVTLGMLESLEQRLRSRIEDAFPGVQATLSDLFDIIVGTSTGGIIAFGLRSGMTPDHIKALYRQLAASVFGKKPTSLFVPNRDGIVARTVEYTPGIGVFGLGGLVGLSKLLQGGWYNESELQRSLQQHFPGAEALQRPLRVYVTSLEVQNNRRLLIGDGIVDLDRSPDTVTQVDPVLAMRATSAAPGYFKPLRGNGLEFVDGGVFANNPLHFFMNSIEMHHGDNPQELQSWQNAIMVSLGTGFFGEPDTGASFWQRFIGGVLQNMTETEVSHQHSATRCLLHGWSYHRLNIRYPPGILVELDAYTEEDLAVLENPVPSARASLSHFRVRRGDLQPADFFGAPAFDLDGIIDDCLG